MALTAVPGAGAKLRGSIFSAIVTELREIYVYKGSDESVTSSAALQNDDALVLPVVANAEYHGELVAITTSAANAAGDVAFGFSFPTLATLQFPGFGPHNALPSGSAADGEWIARPAAVSGTTNIPYGTSTAGVSHLIKINLATGANAGNLQMMWAQQVSNVNATTVKAGSYMWLRRVD